MSVADEGIRELGEYVDSLITIPNAKLLTALGKSVTLLDAFKAANDVLLGAVQGISELITRPGLINVDFADVRTVMNEMGVSMMGQGSASGEERATKAAQDAIASPLLDDVNLKGAQGILVNITAGLDMGIMEFEEVGAAIRDFASDEAIVVVGTVIDPEMTDEIRVTLVATGLDRLTELKAVPAPTQQVPEKKKAPVSTLRPVELEKVAVGDGRTPGYNDRNSSSSSTTSNGENYLDIPAFLRNQAD
jgi:cell division protein FtsZ